MRTTTALRLLATLLGICMSSAAFGQLAIEATMREFQARWKEVSHGSGVFNADNQPAYSWPDGPGGAKAPEYPPDGFYDTVLTDLELTKVLSDAWFNSQIFGYFLDPDLPYGAGGEAAPTCFRWSELQFFHQSDFPFIETRSFIDETNYEIVYQAINCGLSRLDTFVRDYAIEGGVSSPSDSSLSRDPNASTRIIGSRIFAAQATSEHSHILAQDAVDEVADAVAGQAAYAGQNLIPEISVTELLRLEQDPSDNKYTAGAMLVVRTGQLHVNLETADHRPHEGAAAVYLRIFAHQGGNGPTAGAFAPPVPPIPFDWSNPSNPNYYNMCLWKDGIPIGNHQWLDLFEGPLGNPNLTELEVTNRTPPDPNEYQGCEMGVTQRGWMLGEPGEHIQCYGPRSSHAPYTRTVVRISSWCTSPSEVRCESMPGLPIKFLQKLKKRIGDAIDVIKQKVAEVLRFLGISLEDFLNWLFGDWSSPHAAASADSHTDPDAPPEEEKTCDPVDLSDGFKFESTTDMSLNLATGPFSLTRGYVSTPGVYTVAGAGLVGANWNLSIFRNLDVVTTGGSTTCYLGDVDIGSYVEFAPVSGNPNLWKPGGNGRQTLSKQTGTFDGTSIPVWRLRSPGLGETDFYRYDSSSTAVPQHFDGLILSQRDNYGNEHRYKYTSYPLASNPSLSTARLTEVELDRHPNSVRPAARLMLRWNTSGSAAGRVASIRALRWDSRAGAANWVLTNQVDYVYKDSADDFHQDTGTDGDLIQVVQRVQMQDSGTEYMPSTPKFPFSDRLQDDGFHTTVTQYRYHRNATVTDTDERVAVFGRQHQLKLVINPQQIEAIAQAQSIDSAAQAGTLLLGVADGAAPYTGAPTGQKLVDFASKIVSYETASSARVALQYLQTECGCSGNGPHGLRTAYSYTLGTGTRTTQMEQYQRVGTSWSHYRDWTYDFEIASNGQALLTLSSEIDIDAGGRTWSWRRHYDSSNRLIAQETPDACENPTTGLVYHFEYTSNGLPETVLVSSGLSGSKSAIAHLTYSNMGQSATGAIYPLTLERYRSSAGTPTADETETITFDYGFFDGTSVGGSSGLSEAVAWRRTNVEADKTSENGPDSSSGYDSYEVRDTRGRTAWIRSPDRAVTHYEFDDPTGQVTKVTSNAECEIGALGSLYPYDELPPSLSTTGWGLDDSSSRLSDGNELITQYQLDPLGRVTHATFPDGTGLTLNRNRRENLERPGYRYYSLYEATEGVVGSGGHSGPIAVTWFDAGGKVIRRSTMQANALGITQVDGEMVELSRSRLDQSPTGAVTGGRVWTNIEENQSEAWSVQYDPLGRVTSRTSSTGAVTSYVYDIKDRIVEIYTGNTTATALAASIVYDGTNPSDPLAQGVGNGLVTLTRVYTGESGTLAPAYSDAVAKYDWRGRLLRGKSTDKPWSAFEYDNLGRTLRAGLYSSEPTSGVDSSNRLHLSRVEYSQRGLPYRTSTAIDPTDSTPDFLYSNAWFDSLGRSVASSSPNGPTVKRTFDALGRITASYLTDRGGDAAPGASGNYASATSLTGDKVYEQAEYTYGTATTGWNGLPVMTTTLQRLHDDSSSTGALTLSNAIAHFSGVFYDTASRPIRLIDYGTNKEANDVDGEFSIGSTAPTWSSFATPPDVGSSPYQMVGYEYGPNGLVSKVFTKDQNTVVMIDQKQTRYLYDNVNRVIGTVENLTRGDHITPLSWDVGTGRWKTPSGFLDPTKPTENRVTSFVYGPGGHLNEVVAHLPSTASPGDEVLQVTKYEYGVSAASASTDTNSLINSPDLLSKIYFANPSTGLPASIGPDHENVISYAYDQMGRVRSVVDQRNVKHTYTRDGAGRVLSDAATIPSGAGIATNVDKITSTFDTLGRPSLVTSLQGSTTLNQVKFQYSPLGQLEKLFQDVNGVVEIDGSGNPQNDTAVVQYGYSIDESLNRARLSTLTYPHGSIVQLGYGTTSSSDDRMSRPMTISAAFGGTSSQQIAAYSYLGLGSTVGVDLTMIDVQLDYTMAINGARRLNGISNGTSGKYPGFDRFGRIARHTWTDGNTTIGSPGPSGSLGFPSRPPIFSEGYTYDSSSRVATKRDLRPGATTAPQDWQYSYDHLGRMVEARRGDFAYVDDVDYDGDVFTPSSGSLKWALDALGNWDQFDTDVGGDGTFNNQTQSVDGVEDLTETRTHDLRNQLTARVPDTGAPSLPFAYDPASNNNSQKLQAGPTRTMTWDAWGRLVAADDDLTGTPSYHADLSRHEYNGLGWRVRTFEGLADAKMREFYYSAGWQLLEEREFNNGESGITLLRTMEQYWGLRSINDPIVRRVIPASSPSSARVYHQLTDPLFSTVAVLDDTGVLVERVEYEPYGKAKHRWPADFNGDGAFGLDDYNTFFFSSVEAIDSEAYNPDMDLDRDGEVSFNLDVDRAGSLAGALVGQISDDSGPANPFGFAGYHYDTQTRWYDVRNRWYSPNEGRWLSNDPMFGANGWNRFQYAGGYPFMTDPYGLCACPGGGPGAGMEGAAYAQAAAAGYYPMPPRNPDGSIATARQVEVRKAMDAVAAKPRPFDPIQQVQAAISSTATQMANDLVAGKSPQTIISEMAARSFVSAVIDPAREAVHQMDAFGAHNNVEVGFGDYLGQALANYTGMGMLAEGLAGSTYDGQLLGLDERLVKGGAGAAQGAATVLGGASLASKALATDAAVSAGADAAVNAGVESAGGSKCATFGHAESSAYRDTFFASHPELKGEVVVHHAVEQQVLKRYPGIVSEAEMHSGENLRGIPNDLNNTLHLSDIRREWNQFYRQNKTTTRDGLLRKATEIDEKYGSQFNPPR